MVGQDFLATEKCATDIGGDDVFLRCPVWKRGSAGGNVCLSAQDEEVVFHPRHTTPHPPKHGIVIYSLSFYDGGFGVSE